MPASGPRRSRSSGRWCTPTTQPCSIRCTTDGEDRLPLRQRLAACRPRPGFDPAPVLVIDRHILEMECRRRVRRLLPFTARGGHVVLSVEPRTVLADLSDLESVPEQDRDDHGGHRFRPTLAVEGRRMAEGEAGLND